MFLGLVPYEQLVYELTVSYSANLTYIYLLTLLVDIRFKRVFWTSELLVNVVLLPFRIIMPDALRVVIMLTVFVFIPVMTARGNLLYRLGMSIAILLISVVGELAMSYVFMALTGQFYAQPAVSEHLPAAFLGMLAMVSVGIALTLALRAALRRLGMARGGACLGALAPSDAHGFAAAAAFPHRRRCDAIAAVAEGRGDADCHVHCRRT